jgi:CheY-like chemotaxis protein
MHTMRFPLYHRPNALTFLDDDASYLETLALVIPQHWSVRLFTHADDCLAQLQQENTLWEEDVRTHQTMVNDRHAGAALIPKILAYWSSHNQRHALTQTCVVDFAMPSMNGLDFLKQLPAWPANRVLLTGKADEFVAIAAFNEGLIHSFVTKQHPQIGKHLTHILTGQHRKPIDFHDSIWRSALTHEQYAMLQETTVRQDLHTLVSERQWVEYVVVPAPFGILALDQHARAHWVQLELRSDLEAAANLAQDTGQTSAVLQKICAGTHLLNTELLQALGSGDEPSIKTTFTIGNTGSLLGAHFRIEADTVYGVSHHEFLRSLPARSVI